MKAVSIALIAGFAVCPFLQPAWAGEKVLHSFGSGTDGQKPFASPTNVNGTLYGVTVDGGANGDGTLFALDPKSGRETVLYSFCSQQNCADGSEPYGSLIAAKGKLYGTTFDGGSGQGGTVYAFDPKTGAVTVVYSFCSRQNCTDGSQPLAGLTAVKTTLYGTTFDGGAHGFGTVFAIDPKTGAETVLYSFCGQQNCTDGKTPEAGLIDVNGTLYGTTTDGGAQGYGTVFSVSPETGTETVLYSFCSQQACADGGPTEAGLTAVNGTLYGTTYSGGAHDLGAVFSLDPNTGAEKVIYSFCSLENCTDGDDPFAGLLAVKGTLYGMTVDGGEHDGGTVFSLSPTTGAEKVLYSFCSQQNCTDGIGSDAGLIDVGGRLYGTTFYGGAQGLGTVFSLKP